MGERKSDISHKVREKKIAEVLSPISRTFYHESWRENDLLFVKSTLGSLTLKVVVSASLIPGGYRIAVQWMQKKMKNANIKRHQKEFS